MLKKFKYNIFIGLIISFFIFLFAIFLKNQAECNYTENYTKPLHPQFAAINQGKYKFDHHNMIHEGFLKCVIVPIHIKGIILNKYKNKCNHNIRYIDIDIGEHYISLSVTFDFGCKDDGLYSEVQIGDSIFKQSGTLIIILKRDTFEKEYKVGIYPEYWIRKEEVKLPPKELWMKNK